jgi:hypothetical protein
MIALPEALADFIATGGDPRSALGRHWCSLTEALEASLWLNERDRTARAMNDLSEARRLAAGEPGICGDRLTGEVLDARIRASRWCHDVLMDERSRDALFAVLDPVEAAAIEVAADQAARPAPLLSHTSTGEQCESCAGWIAAGERMLTFELRYEATTSDVPPGPPILDMVENRDQREWLAGGLADLRIENELMNTAWHWCAECVTQALSGER